MRVHGDYSQFGGVKVGGFAQEFCRSCTLKKKCRLRFSDAARRIKVPRREQRKHRKGGMLAAYENAKQTAPQSSRPDLNEYYDPDHRVAAAVQCAPADQDFDSEFYRRRRDIFVRRLYPGVPV